MSIAVSYAEFQNASPFTIEVKTLPFLDFGNVVRNSFSDVHVIGLRFLGMSIDNIKIWMDGSLADIYPEDTAPYLRQDLAARGYVFKAIVIDESDLVDFNAGPTDPGWVDMPTTKDTALDLGNARLNPHLEAYSKKLGIAVKPPTTETSLLTAHADIRNFRLLVEFDTTD